jgi:Domain of unknown function (DUF4440)
VTTQASFLLLIFLLLIFLLLTCLLLTRAWKANLTRIAACCCVLVCAASLSASGQQLAAGGTAAGIRALESAWTVGQSRNDSGALDLIFDSALIYVEYGKLITKAEYLSRIKRESPQQDQIVMGPMTVRTFASTAIVVGTYSEKKAEKGSLTLKRWRFIDTWVYKKGGWVLVAAAAVPLS